MDNDNGEHRIAQRSPAVYGVLFLPGLLDGTAAPSQIMLPLTLTYLLSMHMAFYLPVASGAIAGVESVFDQVLNGHSLRSKGVVYSASTSPEELRPLLERSSLIITTDAGSAYSDTFNRLPQAVVCYAEGKVTSVRLRNADRIADQELRAKLVGCTQLINIQAGGFITEGHFSLSW